MQTKRNEKKKTKSDTKQRIKTARRWKRLVKDFNNAHNTHIHTQTSLSANSSYFSPNTVVLTEWAITMVIRKMWSEQQGFERWSWLHANTQKYMQLHFVSFTELHHNHSTHAQRTQSHADRSHRDNTVLLPTPHSNAHFHMHAHILWEFMSKPSPRTHTYSDSCTHTHATCSHPCTPPDRNIYQLAHSQYALAQTGSHTHTNTDTQVHTNMQS